MTAQVEEKISFVDLGNYERKAMTIMALTGNLRLVGETGVAKTTLVHYLVQRYGMRLYQSSLNTDTTRWDLLASDVMNKGSTEIRQGIVKLWITDQNPGIKLLYWDEYNYAQPSVTTLQNQLTDFRKSIWIPEEGKEYRRTDDHWFVISMNPYEKTGYSGTFASNIAQMRRFESLRLEYLPPLEEVTYLLGKGKNNGSEKVHVQKVRTIEYEWARKLVEFASKTRILYREGKLSTPVTTGNLRNYIRFYEAGLDDGEILEIVSGLYLEDEAPQVHKLWEREWK